MSAKDKALPPKLAGRLNKALDAGKGEREIARELKLTRHQVRKAMEERRLAQAALGGSMRAEVPVESISIGSRVRKDYGDVASLARSIDANGLLHPIVVRGTGDASAGYELIAGERRLRAWRESKFAGQPIPVRILDLASIRRGEFAENYERKDFTPSELVEIKRQLEIEFDLAGAAGRRMRAGKKAQEEEAGTVRDLVGAYAGRSGRTVAKAEMVVEAAEKDPERFGSIKEQMDKSGKVDGPARRVRNMLAGDALRAEPPPLPGKGPYRTIVADVPWPADIDGERDVETRGYYPYKTMTLDNIAAIDVKSIAHPDGTALWFWITNFHLVRGCHLPILRAWGFKASTLLTWCKPQLGHGQRLRGATEHAILAVRGEVPCLAGAHQTWFNTTTPRSPEHSGKPSAFFWIVEQTTPAPRYAYLFAGRTLPDNWDGHGDRIGAAPDPAVPLDHPGPLPPSGHVLPARSQLAQDLDAYAERLGRPEGAP
jgi:N6-adenosine-specific RNA methylase IME4/ParB-like chromosome segregation protein Spo0J